MSWPPTGVTRSCAGGVPAAAAVMWSTRVSSVMPDRIVSLTTHAGARSQRPRHETGFTTVPAGPDCATCCSTAVSSAAAPRR